MPQQRLHACVVGWGAKAGQYLNRSHLPPPSRVVVIIREVVFVVVLGLRLWQENGQGLK